MAEATERNARKVRQGIVSSIMGNKSIVVTTTERPKGAAGCSGWFPCPWWWCPPDVRPVRCPPPSVGVSSRSSSAPSKLVDVSFPVMCARLDTSGIHQGRSHLSLA